MLKGIFIRKSRTDEGEKPFWISYADLMTSLMILFLVVMLVSLAALTRSVQSVAEINKENQKLAAAYKESQSQKADLQKVRRKVEARLREVVDKHGLAFRGGHTIDFGSRAQFPQGSDNLTPQQQNTIRNLAPDLLAIANSKDGRDVISRIIVEGFASPEGTYLKNLNLSSKRSERVMCALLDPEPPRGVSRDIRSLFATAGASSTSLKKSRAKSRRIEMRIEFHDELGSDRPQSVVRGEVGSCELD